MEQFSLVVFENKGEGCKEVEDFPICHAEHGAVVFEAGGLDDDGAVVDVGEEGDALRRSCHFEQLHIGAMNSADKTGDRAEPCPTPTLA